MKNVRERFKDDNIFEKMAAISILKDGNAIETIFSKADLSTDMLYQLWLAKSGFKYCSSLSSLSTSVLGHILMSMYNDKWCKVYDELTRDFQKDNVISYSENTKGSSTIDNTETNQTNDNVSAYNDSDFTPNEQNVTNTTGTNKHDSDETRVYTRTSKQKDNFNSKMKAIQFLQKNEFYDIMFRDIDSQLCLGVFDMEEIEDGD